MKGKDSYGKGKGKRDRKGGGGSGGRDGAIGQSSSDEGASSSMRRARTASHLDAVMLGVQAARGTRALSHHALTPFAVAYKGIAMRATADIRHLRKETATAYTGRVLWRGNTAYGRPYRTPMTLREKHKQFASINHGPDGHGESTPPRPPGHREKTTPAVGRTALSRARTRQQ